MDTLQTDITYILMFGRAQVGKTALVLSLLDYFERSDYGNLFPNQKLTTPKELSKIKQGIADLFDDGKFPGRTKVGFAYQTFWEFRPKDKSKPIMKFAFVDIGGEDFQKVGYTEVHKTDNESVNNEEDEEIIDSKNGEIKMLADIEKYFNHEHNIIFLLLMSYEEDKVKDNRLFNDFILYLDNKDTKLLDKTKLMLVTKWDNKPKNDTQTAVSFVKEKAKIVYNLLKNQQNTITYFSVGKLDKTTNSLIERNEERSKAVALWLYEAITKKSLLPKENFWKKFLNT